MHNAVTGRPLAHVLHEQNTENSRVTFAMSGVDPDVATNFFHVNSVTGKLVVADSLTSLPVSNVTVSCSPL